MVGLLFISDDVTEKFRLGLKRIRAAYPELRRHASEDAYRNPTQAELCWAEMGGLYQSLHSGQGLIFKKFSAQTETQCFAQIDDYICKNQAQLERIDFDNVDLSKPTQNLILKLWVGRGWPKFQVHRKNYAPLELWYVDYRLYFGREGGKDAG